MKKIALSTIIIFSLFVNSFAIYKISSIDNNTFAKPVINLAK